MKRRTPAQLVAITLLVGLSARSPDDLLQSAALGLRELLRADSVVLTSVINEHFAKPQRSAPLYSGAFRSM